MANLWASYVSADLVSWPGAIASDGYCQSSSNFLPATGKIINYEVIIIYSKPNMRPASID